MPNSLWDMFQPQDAAGQPASLGDAFTSRSNSLIGLGLGLLAPSNPLRGQILLGPGPGRLPGWRTDRRPHGGGGGATQTASGRSGAGAGQCRSRICTGPSHRCPASNEGCTGANATPEQKANFMKSYYASKTDPGGWILKDIIDPNDPEGERKITVQEHNRTGQIRPPQLPGQTGRGWRGRPAAPASLDAGCTTMRRSMAWAATTRPVLHRLRGSGGTPQHYACPMCQVLTPPH